MLPRDRLLVYGRSKHIYSYKNIDITDIFKYVDDTLVDLRRRTFKCMVNIIIHCLELLFKDINVFTRFVADGQVS